ncbi:MAG: hypothetical protein H6825_10315 [Planctomycetes bacterium]|nr:hypothetical protein [Planctomycetota bacterium]
MHAFSQRFLPWVGLGLLLVAWPAGIPSGSTLYFQEAVQDAAAVYGVSLSNALLAVTP